MAEKVTIIEILNTNALSFSDRQHTLNYLFVCFGSVTAFVPRGQYPREDLRRSTLPTRPLVTPGPYLSSCSLSPPPPPHTYVMHSASGPYLPLSSCPVHILTKYLPWPILVFPSYTYISNPHIYEPLITSTPQILVNCISLLLPTQFYQQYIPRTIAPHVSSMPTCSSAPHLPRWSIPILK